MTLGGIYWSERLLLDAHEFSNAIYEDMTFINELVSIKDPITGSLVPEGFAIFFRGFKVCSSLPPRLMGKVIQQCQMLRLFEGGSIE
jgi:hypothetical protein